MEKTKPVTVRMPVKLAEDLKGLARENRRSLAQQIIFMLLHKVSPPGNQGSEKP